MSKLTYFSALPVELIQHIIHFMLEDEGVSFTLHFTTLKPPTITRFYSFLSEEELFFSVHCLNELTLLYMKYNVGCVSSLANVYSTIIFNRPEFISFFRPLIETSEAKRRDYAFGPLITKLAKNGLRYREYISIDSQRFNRLTLLGAVSGNQVELMHTYLNNNTDYNECLTHAVDHRNLIDFFIQKGATSWTNAGCHLVQSKNTGIEYKKEFIKLFVEKGADIDEIAATAIFCKQGDGYNDMKSLINHIFKTYDSDYLKTLTEVINCDDLEYFKLWDFDTWDQLALYAVRSNAEKILKYCIEQGATNYDELTKKILSEDHFYLCDEHVKVYGEQALEDAINLRNSDIVKKVYKKYQGDLYDNYLLCVAIKNDLSDEVVELFYDKCSDYLDPLREAIFKHRDVLVLRMIHKCNIYDIFDFNIGQSSYIPLEHSEYLVNLVINNTNIRFDREKLETILNQHYY